jgi:hypothetical protein
MRVDRGALCKAGRAARDDGAAPGEHPRRRAAVRLRLAAEQIAMELSCRSFSTSDQSSATTRAFDRGAGWPADLDPLLAAGAGRTVLPARRAICSKGLLRVAM